jgi:hypothetical protein
MNMCRTYKHCYWWGPHSQVTLGNIVIIAAVAATATAAITPPSILQLHFRCVHDSSPLHPPPPSERFANRILHVQGRQHLVLLHSNTLAGNFLQEADAKAIWESFKVSTTYQCTPESTQHAPGYLITSSIEH